MGNSCTTSSLWSALILQHYRYAIVLTGTPIHNKWSNVYGLIHLLKDEPLAPRDDILRALGPLDGGLNDDHPRQEAANKLVMYLLSCRVARLNYRRTRYFMLGLGTQRKNWGHIQAFFEVKFSDCQRHISLRARPVQAT